MDNKMNEMLDLLIKYSVANQEELESITYLDGYNIDASNDVMYAITDYQLVEQILSETVEV